VTEFFTKTYKADGGLPCVAIKQGFLLNPQKVASTGVHYWSKLMSMPQNREGVELPSFQIQEIISAKTYSSTASTHTKFEHVIGTHCIRVI